MADSEYSQKIYEDMKPLCFSKASYPVYWTLIKLSVNLKLNVYLENRNIQYE